MKQIKVFTSKMLFLGLFALMILPACVQKRIPSSGLKIQGMPGDSLFQKAEDRLSKGNYDRALELYTDYLRMYPDSPLVPSALLKIGAVFSAKKEYSQARAAYELIVTKFPGSAFVAEALVASLNTYYQEGRYPEVIEKSASIPDQKLTAGAMVRKYSIQGDAYIASGDSLGGAAAFAKAYSAAEPGEEKDKIMEKLSGVLESLSPEQLKSLLEQNPEPGLRESILYRLGMSYASEDEPEEAIKSLSEFTSEFPESRDSPEALRLMETLREESAYQRYSIGCLLPLSGPYGKFGQKALRGIQLALMEFNRQMPGLPLKLVIEDTGGNALKSAEGVRTLAKKKVAAIIGPIITARSAALEAQARKIPIITLTQKSGIVETGDYVFRNFLTPKVQVKGIVSFAMDELLLRKFAILFPDEKYGRTFMNLFWDEVIAQGGEVVGAEAYDPNRSDFASPIKKLVGLYYKESEGLKEKEKIDNENDSQADKDKEKKAVVDFDALFLPDGPDKAGLILPQLAYYDIVGIYLFGTNLWHSPKLIKMAGSYSQGAIMPEIFYPESSNPIVSEFVNNFENTFGEKPGFIEAISYDSAMTIFTTVASDDVRFRASIKNKLMTMPMVQGVTGLTSFDSNGDAQKRLFMLKISGKKFVELMQKK